MFQREFGILPYRSLEFTYESVKSTEHILPSDFVSYPQTNTFTRKTEYRRFNYERCGQEYTTIVAEHPLEYNPDNLTGNVPYYPTITTENLKLLKEYQTKAESIRNLTLVGRLAEYKYFNMDLIIENAFHRLNEFIVNNKY